MINKKDDIITYPQELSKNSLIKQNSEGLYKVNKNKIVLIK